MSAFARIRMIRPTFSERRRRVMHVCKVTYQQELPTTSDGLCVQHVRELNCIFRLTIQRSSARARVICSAREEPVGRLSMGTCQ
jgi:hypothetical protein